MKIDTSSHLERIGLAEKVTYQEGKYSQILYLAAPRRLHSTSVAPLLSTLVLLSPMDHLWTNEKETFAATTAAYSQELQAALGNRRAEMDSSWDALDKEWAELKQRADAIGFTKLMSWDRCVLQLNVGGLHLNVRRPVLESLHGKKKLHTTASE